MFKKLMAWWNKDRTELADEEGTMTQAQRDVAEEDYESRKDDQSIGGSYAGGAGLGADFERDSEGPPKY
jgi:hypothetical protein